VRPRLPGAGSGERARGFLTAAGEPRLVAAAVAVGALTGLAAIGLFELIRAVQWLAIGSAGPAAELLPSLPAWRVLLAPALGGALVGLVGLFSREVRGHGVPEVMEAVALHGGRLRRRVALTKALASALTIGSGGSVGREGPIVQIGAGVGSTLAQWLALPADRMRTLTAAGAAGGIAASFNAPIAGSFFALEVIARNFAAPTFGPVVLCAVFATIVSRAYFGDAPAFRVPPLETRPAFEAPLSLVLGAFCGLVAAAFTALLARLERVAAGARIPAALKPAAGGLLLGALLLASPHLFGVGHATMDATLRGELPIATLVLLLLLKPLATSITLASGGSGGVFLPSLFLGGLVGGLFAAGAEALLPGSVGAPGAYALVGMAAVLAGTSHAPITGLLLAFELTHDYGVVLPVMLAVAISTLLARALRRESIYTEKLAIRGIHLDHREDLVLRGVLVSALMEPAPPPVRSDAPIDVVLARFLEGDASTLFVSDREGRPVGQVSIHDVKNAVGAQAELRGVAVAGDVCESVSTVEREANAADALERLSRDGRDTLAVVDAAGRLVGVLTLLRLMDVVAREALAGDVVGVAAAAGAEERSLLHLSEGLRLRQIPVGAGLSGRTLRQLEVRSRFGVSVIALRRGGVDQGVDPDRPLAPLDVLVTLGAPADLERLSSALHES